MSNQEYVHGYSEVESCRLEDQASTLNQILHHDTVYPAGSRILEAGAGVGAQTVILAENSPGAEILSIDISAESLKLAEEKVRRCGYSNVTFRQADIFHLPFEQNYFDHVFVCFVLEHLPNPEEALVALKKVLKPGGTITVIEGDHGSAYYHPRSDKAQRTIDCLIRAQEMMGGDSLIGRQVYPLLRNAGFHDVRVTPRVIYADAGRPEMVDGFTLKTFIAMVEGVRESSIEQDLITAEEWEEGIRKLRKTAEVEGTFNYTFFKGVGVR